MLCIGQQKDAAGNRLPEQLVEVDRDGVGGLESSQPAALARGEQKSATVGGIDVKPCSCLAGNVGNVGDRIDRSEVGRAGSGNDCHGQQSLSLQLLDLVTQRYGTHA